jgi:hypothetical protein
MGRVETCFYYQDSYGLLVSCVIEGVTEGHRRLMAITTGAKRRVFVTNRSRDWSEATPNPRKVEMCFYPPTAIYQLRPI